MSAPFPRPVAAVDADLHSCCTVIRDAQRELAEVRRRQSELEELESVLLVTIESRCRRADRLLDERLLSVAPAGEQLAAVEPLPAVGGADRPRIGQGWLGAPSWG